MYCPRINQGRNSLSIEFHRQNMKGAEVCSLIKPKLPVWGFGVAFGTKLGALLPPGDSKLLLHCSAVLGAICPYVSKSGLERVSACIVEPRGWGSTAGKDVLGVLGALAGANCLGTVHSGCNFSVLVLMVQQH